MLERVEGEVVAERGVAERQVRVVADEDGDQADRDQDGRAHGAFEGDHGKEWARLHGRRRRQLGGGRGRVDPRRAGERLRRRSVEHLCPRDLRVERARKLADELAGRAEPVGGVGGQRTGEHRLHHRSVGVDVAGGCQEHLCDRTECVDVDGRRRRLAGAMLGRDEAVRALDQLVAGRAELSVQRRGDAEVGEADVVADVEEEVVRRHVAVNDAELVRGVERDSRLRQPAQRRLAGDGPALDALREGAAAEELHRHVRAAVPRADVVDADDLEHVRESGHRHRLPAQPRARPLVAGRAVGEDLDRHLAAEFAVERRKDVCGAAAVDPLRADVAGGHRSAHRVRTSPEA